jgi:hypothetical protein
MSNVSRLKAMDTITPYVGPVLGFIGTCVVVGFGYYQWRKQNGNPSRAGVAEGKRKASELLWGKLEEVNVRLRSTAPQEAAELASLLREVNTVFLANSLYLADDQQLAANTYIKALHVVSELVGTSDNEAKEEWSNTAAMQLDATSPELRIALEHLSALRTAVKESLLHAAGG